MTNINRQALPFNTTQLGQAARASELREPMDRAAKMLVRRYGLSPSLAKVIARANGCGPWNEK